MNLFTGQKVKVTRRINAHTVYAQYLPNGKPQNEDYDCTSTYKLLIEDREAASVQLIIRTFKVGFHYPSSRAELTARELGCIF